MADDTQYKPDDQDEDYQDGHYHVHDLDDQGTSQHDIDATDPDHFADEVLDSKKDLSSTYDDSSDPDDVPNTDAGGIFDREEVFDEDAEGKEAGTLGHPGIDDDTA